MKNIEIKPDTLINANGFQISIGKRTDQIAIISKATNEFTPFSSIRKGGRLAKIKRLFGKKLVSSTHLFFENITEPELMKIRSILK